MKVLVGACLLLGWFAFMSTLVLAIYKETT